MLNGKLHGKWVADTVFGLIKEESEDFENVKRMEVFNYLY